MAYAFLSLLLYRLLAEETGKDGFGSYALVKQGVVLLFPIVMVGLVAGLPRYLALSSRERGPTSEAYLSAAFGICGGTTAAVAAVALALPEATASLFFGSSSREDLVVPFVALLAATSLFYLTYGYFRGLIRMRFASALQVGAFGLPPPLIVLAFGGEPIGTLILLMALALAVISLLTIGAPLLRSFTRAHRVEIKNAASSLWSYGPRRVPGDLAQLLVFALVPILAAHVGSLADVANLTAGQQVLAIVSLALQPLGLVLLPQLSRLWASDRERASKYVGQLAAFAAHVGIFVSLQTVIYADIAVAVWLGPTFDDAGEVVRVVVTPAALYAVYLMLRSSLDAAAVRSYNSRNNLIAFAVFAAVAASFLGLDVASPVFCVAWAFAAGVATQGALAFLSVHRLFSLQTPRTTCCRSPCRWGSLRVPWDFAARPLVEGSGVELLVLVALEAVLAGVYFGLLIRSRAGWVALVAERFFETSALNGRGLELELSPRPRKPARPRRRSRRPWRA